MLADHPGLGSRIREWVPKSRYRQIVESPCRVFYRYEPATGSYYILHVIRGEKLFQKRLLFQRDLKI
jgi:plasmid stabilization system protein ParE